MTLPFDPQSGLIVVPTRVWGPTRDIIVRLALDTGAAGTVINSDIMVLLGYDPATAQDRRRHCWDTGRDDTAVHGKDTDMRIGYVECVPGRRS